MPLQAADDDAPSYKIKDVMKAAVDGDDKAGAMLKKTESEIPTLLACHHH